MLEEDKDDLLGWPSVVEPNGPVEGLMDRGISEENVQLAGVEQQLQGFENGEESLELRVVGDDDVARVIPGYFDGAMRSVEEIKAMETQGSVDEEESELAMDGDVPELENMPALVECLPAVDEQPAAIKRLPAAIEDVLWSHVKPPVSTGNCKQATFSVDGMEAMETQGSAVLRSGPNGSELPKMSPE